MRDDFHQLVLQLGACERVERAEWLVEQQHFGLHCERARDAHTLLHTAGYFVRQLVLGVREADERQRIVRALIQHGARFSSSEHALDC